ncbi:hypothetical protein IWX47DRAFT_169629 [Phyllosticta citricarpa]
MFLASGDMGAERRAEWTEGVSFDHDFPHPETISVGRVRRSRRGWRPRQRLAGSSALARNAALLHQENFDHHLYNNGPLTIPKFRQTSGATIGFLYEMLHSKRPSRPVPRPFFDTLVSASDEKVSWSSLPFSATLVFTPPANCMNYKCIPPPHSVSPAARSEESASETSAETNVKNSMTPRSTTDSSRTSLHTQLHHRQDQFSIRHSDY